MSNNYYDTLWVNKSSSADEIKKAYRKKAMEYHPDRNKGDKTAEKKFKDINEAYSTLSDSSKKKQYDMFGKTWWAATGGGNPFGWWTSGWYSSAWFWGFEDMFWWWAWSSRTQSSGFDFNIEDLFWWSAWGWRKTRTRQEKPKKPVSLDFEKTYEVPIFDLILGCSIEIKWVYWNTKKIKIAPSTKPWSKLRVKWFGKKEPGKEWNLIVKLEAIMPKHISDVDMSMLERIRENIGY